MTQRKPEHLHLLGPRINVVLQTLHDYNLCWASSCVLIQSYSNFKWWSNTGAGTKLPFSTFMRIREIVDTFLDLVKTLMLVPFQRLFKWNFSNCVVVTKASVVSLQVAKSKKSIMPYNWQQHYWFIGMSFAFFFSFSFFFCLFVCRKCFFFSI